MSKKDKVNGADVPPEEQAPSIMITFAGHLSADIRIGITNCSPMQMWGAARMLEQYATDAWQQNQMQQAMAQARAQQEAMLRSIPQDHQSKRADA